MGYLADMAGGGILGGIWMIMKGEGIFGGCRVGIWMIWRDRGILVGVGWEFGLFGRFGYFLADGDMS